MAMRFIRTRGKLLGKVVRGIDINGNNIVDEVPNVVYDLEGRNCDCLTAGQMFAEITDNGNMVFIFSTCAIDNFPTALQLMHPNWVLISQTDRIARCNGYDYKLDSESSPSVSWPDLPSPPPLPWPRNLIFLVF